MGQGDRIYDTTVIKVTPAFACFCMGVEAEGEHARDTEEAQGGYQLVGCADIIYAISGPIDI